MLGRMSSPHKIASPQAGFSLVELSIVLVILGLLTGAILGGQSLIQAAELRSIGEEYKQWQTAVNTFRDRYFSLPGDTNLANRLWGETNGDNDGEVDFGAGGSVTGEIFTFWQHLALAQLINGEFTGIAGANSNEDSTIGTNVPASKYNGGGWSIFFEAAGGNPNAADFYNGNYGHTYQIGAATAGWEPGSALLSPEEAWNIDTKFDDGQPARGSIVARYWNNLCAAADDGTHAADDLDANYRLDDTADRCAIAFRDAF